MPIRRPAYLVAIAAFALIQGRPAAADDEGGWVILSDSLDRDTWRSPPGTWFQAGDAKLSPDNPKLLVGLPGTGVIINGPIGRTGNLVSKAEFGDIEFHCEFLIPKGSNSGVKFEGLYEIQIQDSHGIAEPKAQHCGGIYPRAELLPRYHYLDDGYPPRVNAAKPAGEWQTLDAVFLAPRFDADGKKTANARLVKVLLNGQVVQEDLELSTPTGHAWVRPEVARGPILLQADHGPVAFRDARVRPYTARP
jgi:hypothetical protein